MNEQTDFSHAHEQLVAVVFDQLPHPFYVIDVDTYQVVLANTAARAAGATAHVTCHAATHGRDQPCDGAEHACPLAMLRKTGQPTLVEHIHLDQQGGRIHVELHGYPIFADDGRLTHMIEYAIDITSRKEAQDELERTNKAYERFVPKQFLNHLGRQQITDVTLGDRAQREMTVLFSDVRSFTRLVEELSPHESFNFVSSFMNTLAPVIRNNHGFIDKFIGDAIMALFGRRPEDAIDAAIGMHRTLQSYNEGRSRAGYLPVSIGVGINTGVLMLGVIGEVDRMDGTVIGDAVNLASRLEGLTRTYGVSILVTQNTLTRVADRERYQIRFLDRIRVKGKAKEVPIYEVVDADPEAMRIAKARTLPDFSNGVALYHLQRRADARELFVRCLQSCPDDHPAQIYLRRCDDPSRDHAPRAEGILAPGTWTESLSVNHKLIDSQHAEFLDRVNGLINAIRDGTDPEELRRLGEFLEEYVVKHFADEERLMRRAAYPELRYHAEVHAGFVRDVRGLLRRLHENAEPEPALLLEVHTLMLDWFVNHIGTLDRRFGKFRAAGRSRSADWHLPRLR